MNQKGFVNIVLVVVIVILVGAVGYFAFVKKSEPVAQQPTPTPATTQTKTPASTPTPKDETSSWKTYTDTNYTIKYPSDWHTRSIDNTGIISSYIELSQPVPDIRAKVEINNYDNPKKLSSKEWYADWTSNRQDPDTSTEAQSITIDGAQAYVRIDRSLSSEGTIIYLVYLQRNDKMYSFWSGGNKKFEQTLLQILSTFKVTN